MNNPPDRKFKLSPERLALLRQMLNEESIYLPHAQDIHRRKETDILPLSYSQERMWILDQLATGTSVYNIPFALHLQGEL